MGFAKFADHETSNIGPPNPPIHRRETSVDKYPLASGIGTTMVNHQRKSNCVGKTQQSSSGLWFQPIPKL
jgi:hypothetical protein